MVDYSAAILESGIARGFQSGPKEDVTVTRTMSGKTYTNINRPPLRYFRFQGAEQSIDGIQSLNAFKQQMRGPAYSFLLKDWGDYQLVGEAILTATGGETTAQIIKTYGSANPYVRNIKYVKSGTLTVYINGVEDSGATETNGVITFSGALTASDVVTVDCEFYVPVRFVYEYSAMNITSQSVNFGYVADLDCEEVLE